MDFSRKRSDKIMRDGDLVIAYERHDSLNHFYLSKGKIFNNRFGVFYHNDMIGKPFGSRIYSKSTSGWLYLLQPTPELWSGAVHTRTQIVNDLDASVVTTLLDVFPGCKVVESGTGSGCMTLSLARAVFPSGHVHTYEYNPTRAETATAEFKRLGVSECITVTCKDVTGKFDPNGEGGFTGVEAGTADAVFLDLPEPWLTLDHAKAVLKPGRNICCYSPCIEQVMKTCEKLRELKFHSMKMVEVRQRPYDGRRNLIETLDLGVENGKKKMSDDSSSGGGAAKSADETAHSSGPCGSDSAVAEAATAAAGAALMEKDADEGGESTHEQQQQEDENGSESGTDNDEQPSKKARHESKTDVNDAKEGDASRPRQQHPPKSYVNGSVIRDIARPLASMKGHTAFLTFALSPLLEGSNSTTTVDK